MASKDMTARVTGVDTYAVGNGESYHKSSDGLEADGSPVEVIGSNGMEMTGQGVANEDCVAPEVWSIVSRHWRTRRRRGGRI
jgi:solute carrier family 35 protein F1/2